MPDLNRTKLRAPPQYLDDDLRVSRGGDGSLFVLMRVAPSERGPLAMLGGEAGELRAGDEVLGVSEQSMSGNNSYLYVRHQGLIQAQAHVHSKLVFKPTNLDSKTHRRLTRAIDSKHVKTKKTQKFIAVVDPEREKEEMDREAERVIKEQEMLAKKQSAAMGRGGYGAGGSRGGGGGGRRNDYYYYSDGRGDGGMMDGDFLENDDEEEDPGGVAAAAGAKLARGGRASGKDAYDDEEEEEEGDEEDEAVEDEDAMDEDEDEKPKKSKKKRGRALESDSEEDE